MGSSGAVLRDAPLQLGAQPQSVPKNRLAQTLQRRKVKTRRRRSSGRLQDAIQTFFKSGKGCYRSHGLLFPQPAGAAPLKPQTVAEGAELRPVLPGNKTTLRSRNVDPMWSLTTALALAGRRPARRPRQRRLQPSQSATGGVGGPPASPQPPLQGRAAEGVERPGPPSSRHLGSAEGPVHIGPSPFQKRDFRV